MKFGEKSEMTGTPLPGEEDGTFCCTSATSSREEEESIMPFWDTEEEVRGEEGGEREREVKEGKRGERGRREGGGEGEEK